MSKNARYHTRGIISRNTLFNSPQLQRLCQEALVYSRITSHFREIYMTSRVGEYPRPRTRKQVHISRYILLSHFRGLSNFWPFLYSAVFAYFAHASVYRAALMHLNLFLKKIDRIKHVVSMIIIYELLTLKFSYCYLQQCIFCGRHILLQIPNGTPSPPLSFLSHWKLSNYYIITELCSPISQDPSFLFLFGVYI